MRKNQLKCPECDRGTLEAKVTQLKGRVRGEIFTIASDALVCPKCGFSTIPKEKMGEFSARVADAYRQKHGLLTSGQIKDCRADLGMTQQQFANYIGVGVASVKRWELGQLQDEAMNELIMLKTNLRAAEDNVAQLSARLGKPTWPATGWQGLVEEYRRSSYGLLKGLWELKDSPKLSVQACQKRFPRALIGNQFPTSSSEGDAETAEANNAPTVGLVA